MMSGQRLTCCPRSYCNYAPPSPIVSTITIPTGYSLALYSKYSRKKQFANQCTGIPRRSFLITDSGILTALDNTVFISFIPASSLCLKAAYVAFYRGLICLFVRQ